MRTIIVCCQEARLQHTIASGVRRRMLPWLKQAGHQCLLANSQTHQIVHYEQQSEAQSVALRLNLIMRWIDNECSCWACLLSQKLLLASATHICSC